MYLLDYMVTPDTKVKKLEPYTDSDASFIMNGKDIKDLTRVEKTYLRMLSKYKDDIYYFKNQDTLNFFRYSVIDELIGTKLCEYMGIPHITYEIASLDGGLGLASKNFRTDTSKFYFYPGEMIGDTSLYSEKLVYLELFKNFCISKENEEEFLRDFFSLCAIDLYMCQGDRNSHNMQFMIDKENGYLKLAKVYDFGECLSNLDYLIDHTNRYLLNPIITITPYNSKELLSKYKLLKDLLEELLKYNLTDAIEDIYSDYKFDKGTFEYEDIMDHYRDKEKLQKYLIKERIMS